MPRNWKQLGCAVVDSLIQKIIKLPGFYSKFTGEMVAIREALKHIEKSETTKWAVYRLNEHTKSHTKHQTKDNASQRNPKHLVDAKTGNKVYMGLFTVRDHGKCPG